MPPKLISAKNQDQYHEGNPIQRRIGRNRRPGDLICNGTDCGDGIKALRREAQKRHRQCRARSAQHRPTPHCLTVFFHRKEVADILPISFLFKNLGQRGFCKGCGHPENADSHIRTVRPDHRSKSHPSHQEYFPVLPASP